MKQVTVCSTMNEFLPALGISMEMLQSMGSVDSPLHGQEDVSVEFAASAYAPTPCQAHAWA